MEKLRATLARRVGYSPREPFYHATPLNIALQDTACTVATSYQISLLYY